MILKMLFVILACIFTVCHGAPGVTNRGATARGRESFSRGLSLRMVDRDGAYSAGGPSYMTDNLRGGTPYTSDGAGTRGRPLMTGGPSEGDRRGNNGYTSGTVGMNSRGFGSHGTTGASAGMGEYRGRVRGDVPREGYIGARGGQNAFPVHGGYCAGEMCADGGLSAGVADGIGTGTRRLMDIRRRNGQNEDIRAYERMSGGPSGDGMGAMGGFMGGMGGMETGIGMGGMGTGIGGMGPAMGGMGPSMGGMGPAMGGMGPSMGEMGRGVGSGMRGGMFGMGGTMGGMPGISGLMGSGMHRMGGPMGGTMFGLGGPIGGGMR